MLSRVGANVQFSCEDNYVLQGAKGITCQRVTETLAAWNDHRPICRGKVPSKIAQTLPRAGYTPENRVKFKGEAWSVPREDLVMCVSS